MAIAHQVMRHGTLHEEVYASDGGGGQTGTMTARAAVAGRFTTASAKTIERYGRLGYENLITWQMVNHLPVRVQGHTTVRDLLGDTSQGRWRIVFRGRTLTIVGYRLPNEGMIHGRAGHINIDCIETPQPVGAMDA